MPTIKITRAVSIAALVITLVMYSAVNRTILIFLVCFLVQSY